MDLTNLVLSKMASCDKATSADGLAEESKTQDVGESKE